jgi:N-acetyltransferase
MTFAQPVALTGSYVTLEPLAEGHVDGLCQAVEDGQIWNTWFQRAFRPPIR